MNMPARVLIVGNDQSLLDARASVLQHFWIIFTTAPPHASVPPASIDVAVFCNTLREEERQIWLTSLRGITPNLPIVTLNAFDSGPRNGADAAVNLDRGPAALVSTIFELLTERGLDHKLWPDSDSSRLWGAVSTSAPN